MSISKPSSSGLAHSSTSESIDNNIKTSPSASSSTSQTIPSPVALNESPTSSRRSNIDTPAFRPPSRPSLDSTYSELSELSIHSNEFQTTHPLIRSISHDVATSPNAGSARSRYRTALHSFYITNYGAMLVLLSQIFGAGMNISTRLLETPGPHGEPMHPFQILFARQSITALLCTSYGIYTKAVPHFPFGAREVRWLLIIRGLSGFFGVFGLYFSLLYLPLSEATVLTFLSPILTCYLCSFVIPGQTFTKQQQLASFVSLVGVVFIAQPASLFKAITSQSPPPPTSPTDGFTTSANSTVTDPSGPQPPTQEEHLMAIGIAMLGVLGATGALTSIRTIGKRAHAFISINYFSVWCTIVTLVALIVFPDVKFRFPGNLMEWALLLSLGFCGFCMQFLLTAGLAYGGTSLTGDSGQTRNRHKFRDVEANDTTIPISASTPDRRLSAEIDATRDAIPATARPKPSSSGTRATSMVYTQMLFAFAGDKFVFGVTPGTWSWIGSVLILAGAVWVASARDKDEKESHDSHDSRGKKARTRSMPGKGGDTTIEETENAETTGLLYDVGDDDDSDTEPVKDMQRDRHGPVESLELRELRS